jgi:hypothetical protein
MNDPRIVDAVASVTDPTIRSAAGAQMRGQPSREDRKPFWP